MLRNGAVVPALPQPMPSNAGRLAMIDDGAAFEVGRRAAERPHEADDRAASPVTTLLRPSVPVATS